MFKDAKYTILGDINQAIEKDADLSLYDVITEILHKRKTLKLLLNKSYRSSFEINNFTQKLLDSKQDFFPFERYEAEPMIVFKDNQAMLDRVIADDITDYLNQGFESIAVICKTSEDAENFYVRSKNFTNLKLVNSTDGEIEKGALVIPAYMSKGLEFDVVLVNDVTKENYASDFDKKLLYIACTRALHRLVLYYTGEKSPFI